MTKILFVCLGNICRSPMAEFVMKDLVERAGLAGTFSIASAATSSEEAGNPVYPPARRKLAEHGIQCAGKTSRQLRAEDYGKYDLLIGMDGRNLRNMERICGGDPEGKIHLLMDYTDRPGEVADPWYTGDFERAWQDILEGCEGLLAHLQDKARSAE
ncbi:MAG: low molecular weight phosphotyrosine protein phosphatase [Oscillospiraceae bacterium]|jgi:protein-tyrosine phosphatase|nr:low molecular weight phosphotyrosine protein phosphatase [Oscillospiraceae bacterium]